MRKGTRGVCALAALASAALLLGVVTAHAAIAGVDRGFAHRGIARTPLPPAYSVPFSDEIVATEALKEGDPCPSESGLLDSLLGAGTSKSLPFTVEAVAKLPSGKVLAAGAGVYSLGDAKSPPVNQVFVARLTADGNLDPGFGKGGIVKLHSEDEVAPQAILHLQGRGEGAVVVAESTVVALEDRTPGRGKKRKKKRRWSSTSPGTPRRGSSTRPTRVGRPSRPLTPEARCARGAP